MLWVTGSLGEQEEVSSSKFFEGYHDFVFFPILLLFSHEIAIDRSSLSF